MRAMLTALSLLILPGCGGIEIYGKSDWYDHDIPEIPVVMPPGALYISEQYRNDDDKKHLGIDTWGKIGTPILAAAPGVVKRSFYEPAYGNRIVLLHGTDAEGGEILTVYKHLKTRDVNEGQIIRRGERIGTMGATGALGMAVHLHFETLVKSQKRGEVHSDPQLHWVDGVGRVTCFDENANYPDHPFRITYPTPCKKS